MILKRPYAFLIKHFRLINFIIAILSSFIIYKTYLVVAFFNDYVNNSYSGSFYTGFYQEYISFWVFFVLILIVLGILVICILFIYKKKKVKLYSISLVYYLLLLLYFIIIRNFMIGLQDELLAAESARACRDISTLALILQIPFFLLFIMRFFGFNIGSYNFKEDLKELEISDKDNEEVEITLNQDTTKFKRMLRRFKREFLYYVKENKFIFIMVCLFIILFTGYIIYNSLPNIVDQEYNQGDIFYINNITYKVEDSIITNLKYNGDFVTKNKYYLVLKLYIENNSLEDISIDYNDFRLELSNNNYLYPEKGKGENFIDYAKNILHNNLKADSKNIYSLVYELDSQNIKKRYRLKINNGIASVENNFIGKYNYVTLTPVIVNELNNEGTYNQNDIIKFTNSNLGNTTLKLSNSLLTKKLIYDYQKCQNDNCLTYKDIVTIDYKSNNKILLAMDYEYKIDTTVPFYNQSNNFNKFISSFMKVKYIKNGLEYTEKILNVTPNNLENKFVVEVPNDVLDASKVYLAIIIRNKEYLVIIK